MGSLRIVGGHLRGRRIRIPKTAGYRPTGERTREALFDILGPEVEGSRFLDAFCGTGAVGLEAASRGAAAVELLDRNREAIRRIEALAAEWGVGERCRARVATLPALPAFEAPFDLIFADPPYDEALAGPFLAAVVAAGVLAGGGTLVIERDAHGAADAAPPGLIHRRGRRYGRSCLEFYRAAG